MSYCLDIYDRDVWKLYRLLCLHHNASIYKLFFDKHWEFSNPETPKRIPNTLIDDGFIL